MKEADKIFISMLSTPIGWLKICANDTGINEVRFVDKPIQECENPATKKAKLQLTEYFSGNRKFFDLPLAPQGTPFQQEVWQQLCEVKYGEVASYLDIATKINRPKACRAVGAANGKNPISIIVPCHRVIGTNGKLTGYAGGLERKAKLLNLESQHDTFTLS